MPEIAPIRGILYDPSRVAVDKVIAPPYDVISEDERRQLEALDPHNCVRLILPRPPEGAASDDDKYPAAAELVRAWTSAGVLKRDARPALYRYHQIFSIKELGDRRFTRTGFIGAVRLHAYDEKVVLPHERTLRGPKADRLKLMRACQAHFSQIFGLYRDPSRTTDEAFATVEARPAELEGRTADGTLHRLWRVTDREAIAAVGKILAAQKVYIADGHHRYETMLALRDELRAAAGDKLGWRAASEYATFFLTNMSDPGLVVLPTHRLIHSLQGFDLDELFARAAQYFAIEAIENGARDVTALKVALHESGKVRPSFAVVAPGRDAAWVFGLQTDPRLPMHPAVARLDVTLLHSLVLERMLGIDREAQEAQRNIAYVKDTADAVARVARGEAQVGFLMNPTRVDHVLDVADAGEVMPQKSTFFYPKIASGLVINPIHPGEELDKAW